MVPSIVDIFTYLLGFELAALLRGHRVYWWLQR
jgi:hypothetical protein